MYVWVAVAMMNKEICLRRTNTLLSSSLRTECRTSVIVMKMCLRHENALRLKGKVNASCFFFFVYDAVVCEKSHFFFLSARLKQKSFFALLVCCVRLTFKIRKYRQISNKDAIRFFFHRKKKIFL